MKKSMKRSQEASKCLARQLPEKGFLKPIWREILIWKGNSLRTLMRTGNFWNGAKFAGIQTFYKEHESLVALLLEFLSTRQDVWF